MNYSYSTAVLKKQELLNELNEINFKNRDFKVIISIDSDKMADIEHSYTYGDKVYSGYVSGLTLFVIHGIKTGTAISTKLSDINKEIPNIKFKP